MEGQIIVINQSRSRADHELLECSLNGDRKRQILELIQTAFAYLFVVLPSVGTFAYVPLWQFVCRSESVGLSTIPAYQPVCLLYLPTRLSTIPAYQPVCLLACLLYLPTSLSVFYTCPLACLLYLSTSLSVFYTCPLACLLYLPTSLSLYYICPLACLPAFLLDPPVCLHACPLDLVPIRLLHLPIYLPVY